MYGPISSSGKALRKTSRRRSCDASQEMISSLFYLTCFCYCSKHPYLAIMGKHNCWLYKGVKIEIEIDSSFVTSLLNLRPCLKSS